MTSRTSKKTAKPATAQEQLAAAMVARAQEQELALTGPDGLLKQLTMTVLEAALGADMTEHLGHAEHADQPRAQWHECTQRLPDQDGAPERGRFGRSGGAARS